MGGVESTIRKQTAIAKKDRDMWVPYKSGNEENNWVMTTEVRDNTTGQNEYLGGPCWAHRGGNPSWTRPQQSSWGINPRAFPYYHGQNTDPHILAAQGDHWDWAPDYTVDLLSYQHH